MGHWIHISTGGTQCISAWLVEAAGIPRGGLVVVQEVFGVNAHIRELAEHFADCGYTTIAPAFFDHLESGVQLGYDRTGMRKGLALARELDMDRVVADVASATEAIGSAGNMGVVGYCWGGTVAFVAGARLGLPAVSFYGSRNVQYLHESALSPLMFHFGQRDRSIPPAAVERHRQTLPHAEVFTYAAGHGFACDQRDSYDADSASLAAQRTLAFFERHLGPTE